MPNHGALSNLDHDAALAEISSGVIADTIAKRYGATAQAVRSALKRANPDAYKSAVSDQVEHWVFDSAKEMDELDADPVCIARARARGDFRLKLASKLNPAYADKIDARSDINVTITIRKGIAGSGAGSAVVAGSVVHTPNNADGAVRLLDNAHALIDDDA